MEAKRANLCLGECRLYNTEEEMERRDFIKLGFIGHHRGLRERHPPRI